MEKCTFTICIRPRSNVFHGGGKVGCSSHSSAQVFREANSGDPAPASTLPVVHLVCPQSSMARTTTFEAAAAAQRDLAQIVERA
eukprot:7188931-Karenia_brevis.AAC.1